MAFELRWLGLEVKYLERARSFYEDTLGCSVTARGETELVVTAGETELILRRPTAVPRGGVHTHYAFSTPAAAYDSWRDRLDDQFQLTEAEFGSYRSLYLDDPDDHCVEIGQAEIDGTATALCGIFEVVLEVADLARAIDFYTTLGFTVVDRGDERARARLSGGTFELELWEPQLGIADARGGCHVDLGLEPTDTDPATCSERVTDQATIDSHDGTVRLLDQDGHWLTLV